MMFVKRKTPFLFPMLLGCVLAALWLVPAALADATKLTSLTISVWPEYDDPRVLVQYDGTLSAQDQVPTQVSMLVPQGAEIYAAAYVSPTGEMLNAGQWQTADAGDGYTRVTFTSQTPQFHLEYYYDAIKGAPDKTLDFAYKSLQPADKVHLEIQVPLKATNFNTNPAAMGTRAGSNHGFEYRTFDYTGVQANQVVKVSATYTKTDPNPSTANVQLPATTTTNTDAAQSTGGGSSVPTAAIVLIAAGIAVAGLGGFAWWKRRGPVPAAAVPARARRGGSEAASFCPQCGRALTADDNYCPRCGTKRRS